MPSTSTFSTMFSAYASVAGTMMLVRSVANELVPYPLRDLLHSRVQRFLCLLSSQTTIIIKEYEGLVKNDVYGAAELFLGTKITPSVGRVRVIKARKESNLAVKVDSGKEITDIFEGIHIKWKFMSSISPSTNSITIHPNKKTDEEKRLFELTFHRKHYKEVIDSYLPYILNRAKTIKEENKEVKLYTISSSFDVKSSWASINLDHPATFDTLAMDRKLKKQIMEDLEMFTRRREFYRKVGKAWKRGYLLYGPPGTGKSSLIAAVANYLKFDVYDLELAQVDSNSDLRGILIGIPKRSILVIEDIDCSIDLSNRDSFDSFDGRRFKSPGSDKVTLSGLLNFIDGLWSSCGDERIIIFTTNKKDRLDPALLRPGRMDMHIHMSYCTREGFHLLASNYLGIEGSNKNKKFAEIAEWVEKSQVTPAEVAEELMKSEDVETALGGLLQFIKRKRTEVPDDLQVDKDECQVPKKQKHESGVSWE